MSEAELNEAASKAGSAPTRRRDDALDKTFHVALVLKGLDGLFELLGGIFLVVVSPDELNRWAHDITQHELSEDPHNFFANHLLHITQNLHHTQLLGAIYLLAHGAAKLVLVIGLWLEKGWSYPFAFVVLTLFIALQIYELSLKPSAGLALLTAFDGLILWLTWREYSRRRDRLQAIALAPDPEPSAPV